MKDINVAEESIKKILDSTTVISDNITHLSATGEEVAASSTEGLPWLIPQSRACKVQEGTGKYLYACG